MTAHYRRVPAETLEQLRANPRLLEDYLTPMALAESEGQAFPIPEQLLTALEGLPDSERKAELAKVQSLLSKAAAAAAAFGKPALGAKLTQAPSPNLAMPSTATESPLDIDKAWHGLHFILCGVADEAPPPLGQVVLGGEPIGNDLGYGPCRFLTPEQVQDVHAALSHITVVAFRAKYDGKALSAADIYPGGWEDTQNVEWLAEEFEAVRTYFTEAAQANQGMLLYLT